MDLNGNLRIATHDNMWHLYIYIYIYISVIRSSPERLIHRRFYRFDGISWLYRRFHHKYMVINDEENAVDSMNNGRKPDEPHGPA